MVIHPEFASDLCVSLHYLPAFLQGSHKLELLHQRRHGYWVCHNNTYTDPIRFYVAAGFNTDFLLKFILD